MSSDSQDPPDGKDTLFSYVAYKEIEKLPPWAVEEFASRDVIKGEKLNLGFLNKGRRNRVGTLVLKGGYRWEDIRIFCKIQTGKPSG